MSSTNNSDNSPEIFDQLKDAGTGNLGEIVRKREGLTEEEFADKWRQGRADVNRAIVLAKIWSIRAAVVIAIVLAGIFALGTVIVLVRYFWSVLADPAETKQFLSLIWSTALIVLATLFVERRFRD